ncbi:MAG: hypothetical protein ACLRV7_01665 [Hoylesella buccalis]|nr:hypothetical protein [Hoylesella buccalis]
MGWSSQNSTLHVPNILVPSIKITRRNRCCFFIRTSAQNQFDQLFGTATFMGKGGEATPIDFNQQFVIAVVLPETSVQTAISAKMLIATKQKITLLYQVDKGARLGYTMRPIMLLVVDKKYDTGKVIIRKR